MGEGDAGIGGAEQDNQLELAMLDRVIDDPALQFKGSADLDRDIAAALARWNVAPASIEVELTESVLMEVSEQHAGTLERLRQLGGSQLPCQGR